MARDLARFQKASTTKNSGEENGNGREKRETKTLQFPCFTANPATKIYSARLSTT
jgi:hypothetical protein